MHQLNESFHGNIFVYVYYLTVFVFLCVDIFVI